MMETKFKIVETEEYTLAVSDEDASNSYIYFTGDPTGIFKTGIKYKSGNGNYFYQDAITGMSDTYLTTISKKIIAYKPKGNAPELDLPLLPEIVVEDDVEKLAESYYTQIRLAERTAFKFGYKAATKVYSEEDLRNAMHFGKFGEYEGIQKTQEFIQSLKQPKWFVAEVEKKMVLNLGIDVRNPNTHVYVNELKTETVNNKTYLVGTYLN
jgi:hypothetical protein